jgi:hypothetical protein
VTAASEYSAPDRERAETYLRLQAEAELRRALAMPEYKPPRDRRAPWAISLAAQAHRMRHRRAMINRLMRQQASGQGQSGQHGGSAAVNQPERHARSLLATLQQAATSSLAVTRSAADPLTRQLRRAANRAENGIAQLRHIAWHTRRRLRRRLPGRFRRRHEEPPAQACLERVSSLASVLAGVGAISAQTESDVVADFTFALAARGRIEAEAMLGDFGFFRHRMAGPSSRHPAPTGPPIAIPVGVAASAEIRDIPIRVYLGVLVFDQGDATLTLHVMFASESFQHDHHHIDPLYEALSDIHAVDDRGGSYEAHFSGGGGDGKWEGRLHLTPAPPAGLRWLDVTLPGDSVVRIPMDTPPADLRVRTEAVTTTAADRLLDAQTAQLLLGSTTGAAELLTGEYEPNLAGMAADLLAAGVVTTSSESLRRLVGAAVLLGVQLPGSLAAIEPASLPQDWLSLRARADREGGPTGIISVAAVLPEVDGTRCVIGDLLSDAGSATMHVHARGWRDSRHRGGLRIEEFWWTARDDLGGWYVLGDVGGSYSDGEADLELGFSPALDSQARALDVILTGATAQVSVTVPLDWQEIP